MDDAQHEEHLLVVEDVVHHAIVAHSQPVERVIGRSNGLDSLAGHPIRNRDLGREVK
jgi:hypothetical protein